MQPRVLINLSGGVDSTYYLWRWASEKPHEPLLVHHCLLYRSRREVEKKATDAVLAYIKDKGFTNFQYVETQFLRDGIPGLVFDLEVIYFLTGLILRQRKSIKTVLMPRCLEEFSSARQLQAHLQLPGRTLSNFAGGHRIASAIAISNLLAKRRLEYISPYQQVSKAQMIEQMPPELFNLTWYCRKPVNGLPCGTCFNCERVKTKATTA